MATEDDPGPAIGLTGARFGGATRRKSARRRPATPVTAGDAVTEVIPVAPAPVPDADGDAPVVGMTGARFGGGPRRRRRPGSRPEDTGSTRDSDGSGYRDPVSGELMWADQETEEQAPRGPAPADPDPDPGDPGAGDRSTSTFVRPYVLTRGRTRSRIELSVETLLSAVPTAVRDPDDSEHLAVLELCREPRSVAEVAALIGVPLGVARVLLGDLAGSGALAVHRSAGAGGPDLALMERVLTGLRRL